MLRNILPNDYVLKQPVSLALQELLFNRRNTHITRYFIQLNTDRLFGAGGFACAAVGSLVGGYLGSKSGETFIDYLLKD